MPRIRFTDTPRLPADLKHLAYRKDQEIECSRDWADKWLRRGVAEELRESAPRANKGARAKDDGKTNEGKAPGPVGKTDDGKAAAPLDVASATEAELRDLFAAHGITPPADVPLDVLRERGADLLASAAAKPPA